MMKDNRTRRPAGRVAILLMLIASVPAPSAAGARSAEDRLRLLEATLQDLLTRDEEKAAIIRRMTAELKALRTGGVAASDEDAADGKALHRGESIVARKVGDTVLRLNSVGVNAAGVAGYSSEVNATTRQLQGGGHDPDNTGFTLQTADFSITGSADGYVDGELHVAYFLNQDGESVVELEEAFLRTNSLPYGLEIEAGQQFLEFGAFNPLHVHDWTFIDQPLVLTRMFGGDGIRQTGVRLGWKIPGTGLALHSGAYNPRGETMKSFLAADETIGGRTFRAQEISGVSDLVYLTRFAGQGDIGNTTHYDIGLSGLTGPNATGNKASTYIAGADLRLATEFSRGRSLVWESEALYRHYELDRDPDAGLPGTALADYGVYTQLVYGFAPKWSAGIRYEYATGNGDGVTLADADADRSNRHRLSPMLRRAFGPGGDLRLQYNYDYADLLNTETNASGAHAVWLGLRFALGAGGEFWSTGEGRAHRH